MTLFKFPQNYYQDNLKKNFPNKARNHFHNKYLKNDIQSGLLEPTMLDIIYNWGVLLSHMSRRNGNYN